MDFSVRDALKYPFVNFRSFWNWLWLFVPIIGWFFFYGYLLQLMNDVIKGKDKGLQKRIGFWDNVKDGFLLIIFLIPVYVVLGLISLALPKWVYILANIVLSVALIFLVPHYAKIRTFKSLYDYPFAFKLLGNNGSAFLWFILYTILVMIVWILASVLVITLVVTIPAMMYGQNYLYAKLYVKATGK